MKQHGSKYFALPPPPLGLGSKGNESTILVHGHITY